MAVGRAQTASAPFGCLLPLLTTEAAAAAVAVAVAAENCWWPLATRALLALLAMITATTKRKHTQRVDLFCGTSHGHHPQVCFKAACIPTPSRSGGTKLSGLQQTAGMHDSCCCDVCCGNSKSHLIGLQARLAGPAFATPRSPLMTTSRRSRAGCGVPLPSEREIRSPQLQRFRLMGISRSTHACASWRAASA